MTPEAQFYAPVRVSIFERLVPSLGFAVAAISGAVGAMMLFRFFRAMRRAETAGYAAFFGGVAEIEFVVGMILIVAAFLCAIGILVSAIRLFTTNSTSSPPGIFFLLTGAISLVPPFAIHYVLHWMKSIVASPVPTEGGISSIADTVTYISYFAVGSAAVIVLSLIAFSFIPFSSRAGKKASPLICLLLVEILIAVLMGVFFWEANLSIAGRDEDRVEQYSQPIESPTANSNPVQVPRTVDDMLSGVNDASPRDDTNTSSGRKTISGGVLNSKAIDLPQPVYPAAARAVKATGAVSVQVTVDVNGKVESAIAVSGHPLLRAAAVQAARQARFPVTKLSGQPVRVTGVLTFNFPQQ